ncbi:uncharacterized protein BDR25DRAFT_357608 [Lindgomyces ingoldianus]|uniref:Uncharacterized protein n=1 Tax=Lindgomyces ingoldianus TaxID=673940 RepID=A0ACB6QN33_9PLEO|nr:uncharacterized protein BDR25DRAFT_357608 [Lindgomyces ingoldianus]KAF2468311.1 hypothetical protein BDR25DRAFT_357608 [Lindgomyces ingoldianus]
MSDKTRYSKQLNKGVRSKQVNSAVHGYDIADLTKIGHSILSSTLLLENTTRAWLKPTLHTSSLYGNVGRPWEIYRAADIGPSKRLVDLYTKQGDIGLYQANLAVVPDYNIGFALAIGGTGAPLWLDDLVVYKLFPALEAAAREQADVVYAGTYTAKNWISNGTDMLIVFAKLFAGDSYTATSEPLTPSALRVYPTNLERETEDGREVAWRMSLDQQAGAVFTGPFSAGNSWGSVDLLVLGKFPIDKFLFTMNGEKGRVKKAVSLSLRAFNVVLEKDGYLSVLGGLGHFEYGWEPAEKLP